MSRRTRELRALAYRLAGEVLRADIGAGWELNTWVETDREEAILSSLIRGISDRLYWRGERLRKRLDGEVDGQPAGEGGR